MNEKQMNQKPHSANSTVQKELDKAEKQFDQFEKEIKDLTVEKLNEAPKEETEPQLKLSSREMDKIDVTYLKPVRTISSKEQFNEKYRADFNYASERVDFIAQHNEIIGEDIETWTKAFPGQDAEFWRVPVNKPVNGPRYLAERIKACSYHRLSMQDRPVSVDSFGSYTGQMIADSTRQRLDAYPVNRRKSIFMGASGF